MKKRVLIVEDDPHIRLGIGETLQAEGYETFEASDGSQVLPLLRQTKPDLILLDIMLPGKNGYDICRDLKKTHPQLPIIILSAKSQEIDKVLGLELGADDYVTKPFSLRELLARVQAVLRRLQPPASNQVPSPAQKIKFGQIQIDPATLRGSHGRVTFALSPRELKILLYLYAHLGQAISREDLLNHVWGMNYYGTTRTLDQVIVKIRQKIESSPAEPAHLLTVHGLGYRLEA
jgi:DNA-binding response OmpR family regulator